MQPAMSSPVPTVAAVADCDAFAAVAECMQLLRRSPQPRMALLASEYASARRQWLEGMLGARSYGAVLDTLIEKMEKAIEKCNAGHDEDEEPCVVEEEQSVDQGRLMCTSSCPLPLLPPDAASAVAAFLAVYYAPLPDWSVCVECRQTMYLTCPECDCPNSVCQQCSYYDHEVIRRTEHGLGCSGWGAYVCGWCLPAWRERQLFMLRQDPSAFEYAGDAPVPSSAVAASQQSAVASSQH